MWKYLTPPKSLTSSQIYHQAYKWFLGISVVAFILSWFLGDRRQSTKLEPRLPNNKIVDFGAKEVEENYKRFPLGHAIVSAL